MKRREVLAVVGTSVGLAGCTGLVGASPCDQGPTAIGDLTAQRGGDVTVQGTVVEVNSETGTFELTDGSGRVSVVTADRPNRNDCVRLGGTVESSCPDAEFCLAPWYWHRV
jgi:hypothetical protein